MQLGLLLAVLYLWPPHGGHSILAARHQASDAAVSDSFPHARHRRLACLTCHDLRSETQPLTFEPPRGCQICHHQRPAKADCRACHEANQLAAAVAVEVTVAVPRHEPQRRPVQFPHAKHDSLACTRCHVTPVTMAPADSARTCIGCHDQHHAQARDCAVCHRPETAAVKHPAMTHVACDRCHTPATIARLVPTRSFCLACHSPEQDHHAEKECSVCHFQRSPAELRQQLSRGRAAS